MSCRSSWARRCKVARSERLALPAIPGSSPAISSLSAGAKLAATLQKLDTFGLPPQAFLGVAGMPGLTAWVGLLNIAALKAGDGVFVSAAAGSVGSVVCQIAKNKGHTVVGSAGGADKGAFLKQIGVDHVIDYKTTGNLTEALLQAAPKGIDIYFDNVGGEHLEAALTVANRFARFTLCGTRNTTLLGSPMDRAIS